MNKILFVFHGGNLQSGATRSLMDIVDSLLKKNKYTIEAVFPDERGSAIDHLRKQNVQVYNYKYGNLMQDLTQPFVKRIIKFPVLCMRFFRVRKAAKKASKELRDKNIDLVYSNTSSIVFGGYLGKALQKPQIWHIREFRIKDHRIKFFLGEKWLKHFINNCSSKVLFVSKSVMEENTDIIDRSKCEVTYNSYSSAFIQPKECFNKNNPLNVLIAGDIKPSKGQLSVMEAVKTIKSNYPDMQIELYIAGRKSNSEYYNRLISERNAYSESEHVHLLGQVSDMKSLRAKMDVGIVASTNEAFGRTTIEGMLSMMAMIGSKSGGTIEQINDGVTGLLYDGSSNDLAEKIAYLYNNRDRMENIAVNGFHEAVKLHTKGNCALIVENSIDEVLSTSI